MAKHAALKLDVMTVEDLVQLRDEIETALSGKIQMEREELQQKLNHLAEVERGVGAQPVGKRPGSGDGKVGRGRGRSGNGVGNGKTHPLKGRTVAPKYRDPENPDQTWAGRGQAPRWLTAYEGQGRKREEFLIGATAGPRAKGRRRR